VKTIPLTQGQFAIVDNEDFALLSSWKWFAQKNVRTFYACRHVYVPDGPNQLVLMHRSLLQTPSGLLSDHIDGNGLNNTRINLRDATPLQNMMNRRGKRGGSSKYKGVWMDQQGDSSKKWRAGIRINGKLNYLGRFCAEEDAAAAYAQSAEKNFGQFCCTVMGDKK